LIEDDVVVVVVVVVSVALIGISWTCLVFDAAGELMTMLGATDKGKREEWGGGELDVFMIHQLSPEEEEEEVCTWRQAQNCGCSLFGGRTPLTQCRDPERRTGGQRWYDGEVTTFCPQTPAEIDGR
jgi:hypothetical protein